MFSKSVFYAPLNQCTPSNSTISSAATSLTTYAPLLLSKPCPQSPNLFAPLRSERARGSQNFVSSEVTALQSCNTLFKSVESEFPITAARGDILRNVVSLQLTGLSNCDLVHFIRKENDYFCIGMPFLSLWVF